VLHSQRVPIEVSSVPLTILSIGTQQQPWRVGAFRPRARALPAPSPELTARQRILSLTGALVNREPPRLVHLNPPEAAAELLAQLQRWGYR
jgi:hypothetical protein